MKYFIETYGCQMNAHDSERMAGLLEQSGYEPARSEDEADLVVLNTCSVREKAEEKLYHRLDDLAHRARSAGRPAPVVAVAGCVAQQEGARLRDRSGLVDVVVGTQRATLLPVLAGEARAARSAGPGPAVLVDVATPYDEPSFPLGLARRADPVRAYVTIVEGCNEACAFCVVPRTRGRERMRARQEILAEVREAAGAGKPEVQLLGQIVNHYQAPDDPRCDLAGLIEAVHEVSGVRRIRFASPHPRHATDRLIAAIRDLPKVARHLHLPVQSGSTRVLARMRRRHTREEYLDLVQRVREAIPDIQLSTDMIVGFPGETAGDFDETLSLTEAVGYHGMFSFKYSPRPHTPAARRMADDVPEEEKTRRIVALQRMQRRIQSALHERLVGRTFEVLVEATSRRRAWELQGRTSGNTIVNFAGPPEWVGRAVPVRIERAGPHSVWGAAVPAGTADGS